MRSLARCALCLGWVTSGCAITALVGENPDAGFAVDAVVASPDLVATPFDAGAPSDVVAPSDLVTAGPDVVDAPSFVDRLVAPRDVPGVMIPDAATPEAGAIGTPDRDAATDATGSDVALAPEAAATADAVSSTPVDAGAEDARPMALDVPPGAACRRDAECVADPAGPFCSLLTMRCGPSR